MSKQSPTKSKKNIEVDEATGKIYPLYRKKCEQNGVGVSPLIKEKLQQATVAGRLQTFQTSQELGPNQARAFIETLLELNYKCLSSFRVWKADIGDEGLRIISLYLRQVPGCSLTVLDLLDNEISHLGCQFLGLSLVKTELVRIKHLKLDSNNIGTEGLKNLSIGLRTNRTLDKLSLKYCNIDQQGSKYIQEIIANINSRLRSLKLQGNPLQNDGVYQILRAVKNCGSTIEKLNIADTKLNLLDYKKESSDQIQFKIRDVLLAILRDNFLLIKMELRFNQIHNLIAEEMLDIATTSKNIKSMDFPNNVQYDLRNALDTLMRQRNKVKKGKKTPKKKK